MPLIEEIDLFGNQNFCVFPSAKPSPYSLCSHSEHIWCKIIKFPFAAERMALCHINLNHALFSLVKSHSFMRWLLKDATSNTDMRVGFNES